MFGMISALGTVGRRLWWSITPLLSVAGIAASFFALGSANAVALACGVALLCASTGWVLRSQVQRPRSVPSLPLIGVLGGATGLAVLGPLLAGGTAGLTVELAVAATGWFVVRSPRENAGESGSDCQESGTAPLPRGPEREHVPADPLPPLASLASLGTEELCRTWRLTYPRLSRAHSPAEVEYLTELRHRCLLQMEQQDPIAFARWLPTARAASDPARYFRDPVPRAAGDVEP